MMNYNPGTRKKDDDEGEEEYQSQTQLKFFEKKNSVYIGFRHLHTQKKRKKNKEHKGNNLSANVRVQTLTKKEYCNSECKGPNELV